MTQISEGRSVVPAPTLPDPPLGHPASGRSRWLAAILLCLYTMTVAPGVQAQRAGSTQGASSSPSPWLNSSQAHLRLNVTFEKVDSEGGVVLKFGAVPVQTRLLGLTLRPGASGVLGMLLPPGASLQAEVVEPGRVPGVILWKGKVNLNEQLLIQGVAEGKH